MSNIIQLGDRVTARGQLRAIGRAAFGGRLLFDDVYCNTIYTSWLNQFIADLVKGTNKAKPVCLAYSREVIASSPQPIDLQGLTHGEVRSSCRVYSSGGVLQLLSILAPSEGNGSGVIRCAGLIYGPTATLVAGTGTLGSFVNGTSIAKDSSIELSLQYEVSFSPE